MIKYSLLVIALIASTAAIAGTDEDIKRAETQLKATFSSLNVSGFNESPIYGLYEVNLGTSIIYFNPEGGLLFFGEIYDKEGKSLTAESLKRSAQKNRKKLPMESGLVIGDPKGKEIIEFTDPACPYCRKHEQFLLPISND